MYPINFKNPIKQFETPFYRCHKHIVQFLSFSKTYYVVDFRRTGAVVCLNQKNEVLLTKQYRFLINQISYEIAGGGIDDGESFAEGAGREFLEETGYVAHELIPLCHFMPGLDNVDNPTEVFLCKNFEKKNDPPINPSEILGVEWVHIDECMRLISSFQIQDGTTIIGLSLAKAYLNK